jgi:hypothetical protein
MTNSRTDSTSRGSTQYLETWTYNNLPAELFRNSEDITEGTDVASGWLQGTAGIGAMQYQNGAPSGEFDIQEIVTYTTNISSTRQPVEYGINNYYNIYPQTSSFTTSSFAIYATTSSISASINNELQSGIASSGPLGFITVSRTGSNSLTLARNGVTSSFAVPASGALSTNLYLGAINNNGLALGSSPYNISFASVGVGLTGADLANLNRLTYNLQTNLGRIDPDAQAFYNRVTAASGSLTATEISAINTLVGDLKSYGIWSSMKAIYPMVGASSASCAQNLVGSSFTGTFNGGWTFANTGVRGNGSTGYMSTGFIPSSSFSTADYHYSIYTRTNAAGDYWDFGGGDAYPKWFGFNVKFSNNLFYFRYGSAQQLNITMTDSNGYFIGTHNSALGMRIFRNSSSIGTGPYDSNLTTRGIEIACSNDAGSRSGFSNREYAFASIGDGLTNAQAANLYTAVQKFQTTLGRQV